MSLEELTRAHKHLRAEVSALYAERARLILQARADGHTWSAIAEALDMTQHGAIKASRMTAD